MIPEYIFSNMNKYGILFLPILVTGLLDGCGRQSDQLHIVTTGDVHGQFFATDLAGGEIRPSLEAVKYYTDSLRRQYGKNSVLLLDAGDILQGDNTVYYFNYVDTVAEHIYPRIAGYMGYDAIVLGNHDIETGHPVYDRVVPQLERRGIPVLAGNIVKADNGEAYFPYYTIIRKCGRRIAVLGFDNANIKGWLPEHLWSGLDFLSLTECVQEKVDEVREKESPDLVVVAVHSGTGKGDGTMLENQSLDLLHSLKGVDILVGAHDHTPYTAEHGGCIYVDGGAKANSVGHVTVDFTTGERQHEIARPDKKLRDRKMADMFSEEIRQVKAFTDTKAGELGMELSADDALGGMCDYMNLLHTVQLKETGASLSFAAPIGRGRLAEEGDVTVNDLFRIYPYENQMFVMRLSGREIKDYLEYSYAAWLDRDCREHLLGISEKADERTGDSGWSLNGRIYNFDSAAGLVYTVDINQPQGKRISIKSLADGSSFRNDEYYTVAMTSYRATGGGDLLAEGAGLTPDEMKSRIVSRHVEIRELLKRFFETHGKVTPETVYDAERMGCWKFMPEARAKELFTKDIELLSR